MASEKPFTLDNFFVFAKTPFKEALANSSDILFITHEMCMDGVGCKCVMHEIFKHVCKATLTTIETAYGDKQEVAILKELAESTDFDMVVVADMSIASTDVMMRLADKVDSFYIFDHHPNKLLSVTIDKEPTLRHAGVALNFKHFGVTLQDNASGAMLMYLAAVAEGLLDKAALEMLRPLVTLISDYDTHKHSIPMIKEYTDSLAHYGLVEPCSTEELSACASALFSKNSSPLRTKLLDDVTARTAALDVHCMRIFSNATIVQVYEPYSSTELCSALIVIGEYAKRSSYYSFFTKTKPEDTTTFILIDNAGGGISIRSTEGGHANTIASAFGGGGHPNASGIPSENVDAFLARWKEQGGHRLCLSLLWTHLKQEEAIVG